MARIINEKAGRTQLDHDGPGGENAAGNGFRSGIPSAGENFGTGQKAGSGGCFGRYRPYHICGQGDFRQLLWPAEQAALCFVDAGFIIQWREGAD